MRQKTQKCGPEPKRSKVLYAFIIQSHITDAEKAMYVIFSGTVKPSVEPLTAYSSSISSWRFCFAASSACSFGPGSRNAARRAASKSDSSSRSSLSSSAVSALYDCLGLNAQDPCLGWGPWGAAISASLPVTVLGGNLSTSARWASVVAMAPSPDGTAIRPVTPRMGNARFAVSKPLLRRGTQKTARLAMRSGCKVAAARQAIRRTLRERCAILAEDKTLAG
mmetsp:Transcript_20913/g.40891  ORF Transcript_20913/g.40891 Transcript_20913/m.40891 type:complete len:222 (+) Transcript_20913:401-1066(+)